MNDPGLPIWPGYQSDNSQVMVFDTTTAAGPERGTLPLSPEPSKRQTFAGELAAGAVTLPGCSVEIQIFQPARIKCNAGDRTIAQCHFS